jgi:CRP-like cAMP-binding protein
MGRIIYSFTEKIFNRNQTVYNEGEESEYIYLVKDGEFEVTRKRRTIVKPKSTISHYDLIGQ